MGAVHDPMSFGKITRPLIEKLIKEMIEKTHPKLIEKKHRRIGVGGGARDAPAQAAGGAPPSKSAAQHARAEAGGGPAQAQQEGQEPRRARSRKCPPCGPRCAAAAGSATPSAGEGSGGRRRRGVADGHEAEAHRAEAYDTPGAGLEQRPPLLRPVGRLLGNQGKGVGLRPRHILRVRGGGRGRKPDGGRPPRALHPHCFSFF